jgi:ketosteroid isomerase-like protein
MSHWDPQADFVDIHGDFHENRDLIAALFRRGFADHPNRKMRLNSHARKQLSPTVAMDDGVLELTEPDGEQHRGRYTVVWTKVGDKWLIRSARDIPIEKQLEPAETQTAPLEELAWLVGKWESKSDKYQIQLDCDWQLDKNYLVQNFHIKSDEGGFLVVTFITFDPVSARFRSWYFDSRGGFGGGAWTRLAEKFKVGVVAVLPDGGVGSSAMIWSRDGADTLIWESTEREVDGEPLPDAKQTYVRVK